MPRRLLIPQDDLCLPGLSKLGNVMVIMDSYQLYAVERWIVDRTALLRLLLVYTADPAHSVHLHVYRPDTDDDDDDSWSRALHRLAAQSGARPKQTTEGVLMLTSLAHFRSDYNIVHIPHGLFSPPVKNQLYSNINLLRLGSSGRTALTLSDPSETTKERFLSRYHTKPSLILPLVSLIQSALSIFGYPLNTDGLLCDSTVQAIARWLDIFASPSDHILDPSFIAALLSQVLSTRNKLAHLGYAHLLPPDPFAHPSAGLSPALAAYSQSPSPFVPLTNDLLASISASFDSKRLSRVIRTKRNSDTPQTTSTTDSLLASISDLPTFIAIVSSSPDIAPASLSTVWSPSTSPDPPLTSKPPKRHKQNQFSRGGVASDGDNARTRTNTYDGRSTEEESDPLHRFSSLGHSFHWPPRRVKLRSWAALTKRKHQSVDLTPVKPKSPQDRDRPLPPLPRVHVSKQPEATSALTVNTSIHKQRTSTSRRSTIGFGVPTASVDTGRAQSPTLPALQTSFFAEGDDEDLLSSGQVSPLSTYRDAQTRPNPFYFSLGDSQAHQHITAHTHSVDTGSKPTSSLSARTATGVHQNLNIDEKMLAKLLLDKGKGTKMKRDHSNDTSGSGGGSGTSGFGGRIASWAGPISVGGRKWADSDESEEEEDGSDVSGLKKSIGIIKIKSAGLAPPREKERARFDSLVQVVDQEGRLVEEEMDSEDEEDNSAEESGSEYGSRRSRVRRRAHAGDSRHESDVNEEEEEIVRRRAMRSIVKGELKRRRSFHDLDTFRGLQVLSPERMKIDVELCGQCLIMWRREKHLRNVVDCVGLLTSTLSSSNSFLRTHHQSHLPTVTALTSLPASVTLNRASVYPSTTNVASSTSTSRSPSPKPKKLATPSSPPFLHSPSPPFFSHSPLPTHTFPAHLLQSIDEASQQTERFSQATNTLMYENEQLDVGGLWSWVGRERQKVWALRGGVFGEGNGGARRGNDDGNNGVETAQAGVGRKLPEGVHGAHEPFNRLQWRLDGRAVLVDDLGRTESEAEEEEEGRVERRGADVDGKVGAYAGSGTRESDLSSEGDQRREATHGQAKGKTGYAQREDEEMELEFLDRHLGIKPMWLLKFFTSWGARWSAAAANTTSGTGNAAGATNETGESETADPKTLILGSQNGSGGDVREDVVDSGSSQEDKTELPRLGISTSDAT